MAAYVLDTSAVVKRYIQEIGTGWVRSIADPAAAHLIYLARITDVEVTSAIIRRQRGGASWPSTPPLPCSSSARTWFSVTAHRSHAQLVIHCPVARGTAWPSCLRCRAARRHH